MSKKSLSLAEARRLAAKQLAEMSGEEDVAITAAAESDPDNPPADDLIRRRGRPPAANPKQAVSLRLDADVIDHFKAGGPGWQTRINDMLRSVTGLNK